MNPQSQGSNPIRIAGILSQSWRLYRHNFLLIVGISVLGEACYLLTTLTSVLSNAAVGFLLTSLLSLVGVFVSFWGSAALTIAISHRYAGKPITLQAAFKAVAGKYWRFIGISMLYFLTLAAGFLLVVIPAFYWGTVFYLASTAVVLEDRRDMGPFRLSRQLIQGYFWKVLGLGFILLLVGVLLGPVIRLLKLPPHTSQLLSLIPVTLYMPFFMAVLVVLYHQLKERKQAELASIPSEVAQRGKGTGCAVGFGLTLLIIVLTGFWIGQLRKYIGTEKLLQTVANMGASPVTFPITFPTGLTLESASGWMVRKSLYTQEPTYRFEKPDCYTVKGFTLQFIPLKKLDLAQPLPPLDEPIIIEKIVEASLGEFGAGFFEELFETQPASLVSLGGRFWGEHTTRSAKRRGYSTSTRVLKTLYTNVGDYMIVASYGYRLVEVVRTRKAQEAGVNVEKERLKEEHLAAEEQAVRDFLGALRFGGVEK